MTARHARRFLRPILPFVLFAAAQAGMAQTQQSQVQRGEYLARAGDCVSCHTANGGAPFAGGLRLDTPFGYMLSPNITPDKETGIGDWTDADFIKAVHEGISKDGTRLLMIKSAKPSTAADRIHILVNWFDELRRLLPAGN